MLFGGGVTLVLLAIYPMEVLIALSIAYLALIPVGMRRHKALADRKKRRPPRPRDFAAVARRGAFEKLKLTKHFSRGGPVRRRIDGQPGPRGATCKYEYWAPGRGAVSRNGIATARTVEPVRAGAPGFSARTQSSLAVSANGRDWVLLNASPDLRQQIAASAVLAPTQQDGVRASPIKAVVVNEWRRGSCRRAVQSARGAAVVDYGARRVLDVLAANKIFDVLAPACVSRLELARGAPIT